MRILVDTQCWLWLQTDPDRVGPEALMTLESPGTQAVLSAASCWEIAIKYAIGKLPLPEEPGIYVPRRIASSGVKPLEVQPRHALKVAELPMYHRDPFDRLLVAQAQLEGLTLMTNDRHFEPYEVEVNWVG